MTVGTTNIIAPVFSATEIVTFLSSGMTSQTTLGYFFRRLVLKPDDLFRITFLCVSFARAMTRFATSYLPFPTTDL